MNEQVSAPWATRDAATKTATPSKAPETAESAAGAPGSTETPSEGTNEAASPDSAAAPGTDVQASAAPAVEVADEVTVTVVVPKAFKLRIDHHNLFDYQPGTQEMPLSHADHWYSKANGVKVYRKD